MKKISNVLFAAFAVSLILNAGGALQYFVPVFAGLIFIASLVTSKLVGFALSVVVPADVTFAGEQIQSVSEGIQKAFFSNKKINEVLTVLTGLKAKQQIAVFGHLGLVGRTFSGCEPTPNPGQIRATTKTWDPVYIEDRFTQCWKDLLPSFWAYGLKNGVDKADLTGTDFANFLEERISEAMVEAAWRIGFFAGTTHSPVGDGAGNGLLTAGVDKTFFNMLNGIWAQIFTIVAGDAARKTAIANNAGADKAAQAFTTTDTTNKLVSGIFETMILSADFRLRDNEKKVILCTQSMADQYVKELKKQDLPSAYERRESGIQTLQIDGVTIIPLSIWDRIIRAYFDNGTKWHLPHRAILTSMDNLQIGTEEVNNLTELKPFYLEKEKTYNVDFGFNYDAKIVEDDMFQVAY